MKRFAFRLEPVLRWKKQKERMAELHQQQARQQLDLVLAEAASLETALVEIGEELERQVGKATATGSWVSLYDQAAYVTSALAAAEGRVRQAKGALNDADAARVKAASEVKALDLLEAQKRRDHARATARAAQHELDEYTLGRWQAGRAADGPGIGLAGRRRIAMMKILVVVVVGGVLFCLAAAGSWYWKQSKMSSGEEGSAPEASSSLPENPGKVAAGVHGAAPASTGQRTAVRPPYTAGAEEAVQLANNLRERLAAARERETRLATREKQLDLVYQDIRGERAAVDELRKQVGDELKAAQEQLTQVERKRTEVEQQRLEMTDRTSQMQKNLIEMEDVEKKNIDKMAKMYASMPPENAARILQQMADTGKMDTVVKVLGETQERQAAKILAEMPEALAAQLLDKLKSLKRNPSAPKP